MSDSEEVPAEPRAVGKRLKAYKPILSLEQAASLELEVEKRIATNPELLNALLQRIPEATRAKLVAREWTSVVTSLVSGLVGILK